jgi:hypothetical protein
MTVSFRFYGHLNAFLPPLRRGARFRCQIQTAASARDVIDTMGVPHLQVEIVVVNDVPVDFGHQLEDGDNVAVYPPFRSIDLGDTIRGRS